MPEPFTAEQWFGMSADMKTAFPDLDYHFVVQNVDGSVVNTTHQLSGTHTGSFDLTAMGMSVFPATGKSFSLGQEPAQVIIRDGKIISYKIQITKGAGLMALLGQLGIKTPSM
jgi:predicted ester cyclase